jgi:hypothetical protein
VKFIIINGGATKRAVLRPAACILASLNTTTERWTPAPATSNTKTAHKQ